MHHKLCRSIANEQGTLKYLNQEDKKVIKEIKQLLQYIIILLIIHFSLEIFILVHHSYNIIKKIQLVFDCIANINRLSKIIFPKYVLVQY